MRCLARKKDSSQVLSRSLRREISTADAHSEKGVDWKFGVAGQN